MYNVGDIVFDTEKVQYVEIIDHRHTAQLHTYKVRTFRALDGGTRYPTTEACLRAIRWTFLGIVLWPSGKPPGGNRATMKMLHFARLYGATPATIARLIRET